MDELPNWFKPLPGLMILGVSLVAYFNGYVWPWGWGAGVALFCIGLFMIKKDDGYKF